jgi:hypothetical protein
MTRMDPLSRRNRNTSAPCNIDARLDLPVWGAQDPIEIIPDGPRLLSDRFNTDGMLVMG